MRFVSMRTAAGMFIAVTVAIAAGCNVGNNQAANHGGGMGAQGVRGGHTAHQQGMQGNNGQMGLGQRADQGANDRNAAFGNEGRTMVRGSGGTDAAGNRVIGSQHANRVDIAQQAAEHVTELPEVTQANVLLMGGNAYVAAVIGDRRGEMTAELESRIAEKVRAAQADIGTVYVSTNPGFVQMAGDYVRNFNEGRPVDGFVQRFTDMAERLFPNAR